MVLVNKSSGKSGSAISPPTQEEINQNQQLLICIAITTHAAFSEAAIQNVNKLEYKTNFVNCLRIQLYDVV